MRHPLITSLLALAALHTPGPGVLHAQDDKQRTRCNQTIDLFKTNDPNLEKFFGSAVGYAIFPSVGKGAFVVGGAAGTGCLYEGGAIIGQAKLGQVTVGLQLGGQSYAEVIFFQNRDAIDAFKGNSRAERAGQRRRRRQRRLRQRQVPARRARLHARQDGADVRGVGGRAEVHVQADGRRLVGQAE